MAIEQPAWGQVRVSEALKRAAGPVDLAGGRAVRVAAPRSDLDQTPPQGAGSQGGARWLLLTEAQIAALEKAKADKAAMVVDTPPADPEPAYNNPPPNGGRFPGLADQADQNPAEDPADPEPPLADPEPTPASPRQL